MVSALLSKCRWDKPDSCLPLGKSRGTDLCRGSKRRCLRWCWAGTTCEKSSCKNRGGNNCGPVRKVPRTPWALCDFRAGFSDTWPSPSPPTGTVYTRTWENSQTGASWCCPSTKDKQKDSEHSVSISFPSGTTLRSPRHYFTESSMTAPRKVTLPSPFYKSVNWD